ncbi:hypothetical protein BTO30_07720 [Domibacillus antri]|uniref:Flagellar hook-length control protein-like C-terminal domain-containing protein n=1 Tax=Domibacillus antri TaxID=1714264 RepID=A0A1Q8Q634_9BACI|nr:hypothetical protein [Domibacillus antri]OLN22804.1 hypothetical protein BTO30_07720 [Domibacillus antri]
MEVGQSAIQRGIRTQPGGNPVDMLKEGQIFFGKTIKLLPGQMAELAAFGQKMTAQLEVPLQAGERYFFQVTSREGEIRLNVVSDNASMQQRMPDQAAALLEKLQLPVTKESVAFTSLAIETGRPLSKENIQMAAAWLSKAGLKDGMEALRFMFSRHLPLTENLFQSLVSARSTESLTGKLASLQQTLVQIGDAPEAAAVISRLLGDLPLSQAGRGLPLADVNNKAVQMAAALLSGSPAEKTAALQTIQKALNMPIVPQTEDVASQLAAVVKNLSNAVLVKQDSMPAVQAMKEALIQLASRPITQESIAAFKDAAASSLPINHPERTAILQQVTQLTEQLQKGLPAENRQIAALFQLAASAAVTVPEQAALRMAALIGTDTIPFEETPVPVQTAANGKEAAAAIKEAFRLLGIDHEALITSKNQPENMQQNVKQELLKLMSETIPPPVREAAEQIVGRLNAQHILSAESGPLQQLVMQLPVHLAAFQGDLTIKWQGRKKTDGKIDADFCRVLFYVDMPNLKNTVIDMQVQNRIIHLNIMAAAPASLKKLSSTALDHLKASLEEHGYKLSGVQFKQPSGKEEEHRALSPLAKIMDSEGYMGVDILI